MASSLPTFEFAEVPRKSTPPLVNRTLDLEEPAHDGNTLSPMSAHFPAYISMNSGASLGSPQRSSRLSPYSPSFGSSDNDRTGTGASDSGRQPFNFTPQQYVVGRPPAAASLAAAAKQAELGRRRGHKYARSSISHQIILPPTQRLPLQLPTSLPIPTFKEFRASMTGQQRTRWLFCGLQLLVAGYVQWQAHESMSMTALSHLLFFDALSTILCNAMDVGRNFEVWTRSSLRNPFGLERTELVAGLAMSIMLLFMGLDLISHGLTHSLENVGAHVAHHAHSHEHNAPGNVNTAALAAIISTLVSAASLGNHARIGRAFRPSKLPTWLPHVLRNPSHLLTLSIASLQVILPLFTVHIPAWFDNGLAFAIAVSMLILGSRLCYSIGRVLLMSFPARDGDEIKELVADLWDDEAVAEVDEAKVWQVHYGLCMANFRVKVRQKDAVERIRDKIASLVRTRLGGETTSERSVRWEVSSMITVVRD